MAKVTGRSDDMMIVRGVNVFPSQIEEQVLGQMALSPHYQIELTRAGNLDALTVHVELARRDGPGRIGRKVAVGEILLHQKMGPWVAVLVRQGAQIVQEARVGGTGAGRLVDQAA